MYGGMFFKEKKNVELEQKKATKTLQNCTFLNLVLEPCLQCNVVVWIHSGLKKKSLKPLKRIFYINSLWILWIESGVPLFWVAFSTKVFWNLCYYLSDLHFLEEFYVPNNMVVNRLFGLGFVFGLVIAKQQTGNKKSLSCKKNSKKILKKSYPRCL